MVKFPTIKLQQRFVGKSTQHFSSRARTTVATISKAQQVLQRYSNGNGAAPQVPQLAIVSALQISR